MVEDKFNIGHTQFQLLQERGFSAIGKMRKKEFESEADSKVKVIY